ncbi:hypothetical protein KGD82_16330 [Nocardiopsis eucommiae]|uniref:Uncharacterized protein n=1 Tax=Nocardiopsis eucommiae TaxID=2831970 RepID=A0A975L6J9_9ACTN|nr:hypothetical protein KGD82_16330 [Nocardiopsis eucommiae]
MKPQRPGEIVRVDYAGVGEAMRQDGVRKATAQRARDIATNANALARGMGINATITVREGTRNRSRGKGRPEAQVRAETTDVGERAHLLSLLEAAGRVK